MTPERWKLVRELLGEALELPVSERPAFLSRHCTHDPSLREELEALLAEGEDSGGFLETPALSQVVAALKAPEITVDFSYGSASHRTHTGLPSPDAMAEAYGFIGHRIGPYQILAEVGRGGMGVVCLAERADDQYRKRVALKLMRQGLDRTELGKRFKRERQILANLEHPNIAHLLDGGTTEDGLPYFVMEYVDGQPIDQWCQGQHLPVEARLELFLQVCSAVQHAHQNLIIHRDLKPSNILVTREGAPKLLDFGIAKVLESDTGSEAAELTHTHQRAMTPMYASPEQVQGLTPTTATDIYSLGVILFELLSEHRPYTLKSFSPVELMRVICVEEPRQLSSVATPKRLAQRLAGDLDMILAKTLRKEPGARYLSVEQLAEDVRRHLQGLPILARQGNARYRAEKFVRRNAYLVAASAAFVGLLIISLILLGIQATRVAAERDAARLERDKAEQVASLLRGLFEVNAPTESRGRSITARELLDHGADRIRLELKDQPALQSELMDVMAKVYISLAQYQTAEALLRDALTRRREAGLGEPLEWATLWTHLAEVQQAQAAYAAADASLQEALTLQYQALGEEHEVVVATLTQQAKLEQARGDFARAEELLQQVLGISLRLYGPDRVEVAKTQNELGVAIDQQGKAGDAERWYRTALRTLERIGETKRPEYASALNNLGGALSFRGQYDEAIQAHQSALELRKQLLGPTHPSVARSLNNLASVYSAQGKFAQATPLAKEALELKRTLYTEAHPETVKAMDLLIKLGLGQGDLSVEPLARRAVALRSQLLGANHPDTAISMGTLGMVLLDKGVGGTQAAVDEAAPLLTQALTIQRRKMGPSTSELGMTLLGLGRVYRMQGDLAQAEILLREGVTLWENAPLDLTWWRAKARCELGHCLLAQGRTQEGLPLLQKGHEELVQLLGPAHAYTLQAASAMTLSSRR